MHGTVHLTIFFVCSVTIRAADLMPGAPVEQEDTSSVDIKALAEQAIDEYNKRSNDLYPYILVKVLGVKTQVVNGVNYELELQIAQNKNCRKGAVCTNSQPTESPKVITANVLSQPWHENNLFQ